MSLAGNPLGLRPQALRVLTAVACFPCLAHAARRLHCSQAVLREQIAQLQAELCDGVVWTDGQHIRLAPDWVCALGVLGKTQR